MQMSPIITKFALAAFTSKISFAKIKQRIYHVSYSAASFKDLTTPFKKRGQRKFVKCLLNKRAARKIIISFGTVSRFTT